MSHEAAGPVIAGRSLWSAWWTPQLAGPVIVAAVLRLALMAAALVHSGTDILSFGDTSSYLIPGRNLLLHGRFMADGVPDLLRTPGYPLFLAVTTLGGLHAAALINMLVSIFTVVVVSKLGRVVFQNDSIAVGAAWLTAIEPGLASSSYILLSETLFVALLLLSLERLAAFLRKPRLGMLMVSGLWLAAATLVRPVTYYLPVALALGLLVIFVRVPRLRWQAPAVLLISVLPWLAAWQIRNRVETGYSGFSSVSDVNLYFLSAGDVIARIEHRPPMEVIMELGYGDFRGNSGQVYLDQHYLARYPEQARWSQAQRLNFLHSQAVAVLRAHPSIYLRSCLMDLIVMLSHPGAYSWGQHPLSLNDIAEAASPTVAWPERWRGVLAIAIERPRAATEKVVSWIFLLALYLFAIWGVFRSGLRNACLWLLVGVAIYLLTVSVATTGAYPSPRLRIPVMPILCILAAAGLQRPRGYFEEGSS